MESNRTHYLGVHSFGCDDWGNNCSTHWFTAGLEDTKGIFIRSSNNKRNLCKGCVGSEPAHLPFFA